MSVELVDFRGKITPETNAVLEAFNRANGKDKSEIVREILHQWASERITEASVLNTMLRAQGLGGIPEGK